MNGRDKVQQSLAKTNKILLYDSPPELLNISSTMIPDFHIVKETERKSVRPHLLKIHIYFLYTKSIWYSKSHFILYHLELALTTCNSTIFCILVEVMVWMENRIRMLEYMKTITTNHKQSVVISTFFPYRKPRKIYIKHCHRGCYSKGFKFEICSPDMVYKRTLFVRSFRYIRVGQRKWC